VAEDHPFDPGVLELLRDYLSRVRARSFVEDVLRRDFDVFAQELLREEEVECGGRDNDLWRCLLAAELQEGWVRCSCRLQAGKVRCGVAGMDEMRGSSRCSEKRKSTHRLRG
jgi:hypothetical protein